MSLFQELFEILRQDDWKFDFDIKNEIIKLEISGVNTNFHIFLLVDEKQESLLCNTYLKQKIHHLGVVAVNGIKKSLIKIARTIDNQQRHQL